MRVRSASRTGARQRSWQHRDLVVGLIALLPLVEVLMISPEGPKETPPEPVHDPDQEPGEPEPPRKQLPPREPPEIIA